MPSSTLVAAAEAAPPLRRRQRRPFESVTLRLPVFHSLDVLPPRDWAAGLPPELLSCILHRLDHVQIMLGADKVCSSWRRAALDEPELWRHIDMRGYKALSDRNLVDLNQMAVEAVRRSQGQCQAFSVEGYGLHDDSILFLGNHAPLLKRLVLVSCGGLSGQGFMQAIKGFPKLEELHLSNCWRYLQRVGVFEVIAKECPLLKYLRICDDPYGYIEDEDDVEAMAIAEMQELRSLQLVNNNVLRNQGLVAILDNCIHLKSLDILNCYRIDMTPEMEARIKARKLLMNYSKDGRWGGFDNEQDSPTSECSTCLDYFGPNNEGRFRKRYPHNYYGLDYEQIYPSDEKETMVISAVSELRSLELYRNDLTSKGLAAVLDKCPQLEPLDVWNCLNIVGNNNNALLAKWHRMKTKKVTTLRATPMSKWIKTKKLTTMLLMDRSYNLKNNVFNPEGLDMRNCRNMVLNSYHGRRIIMDDNLGAKYKRLQLRKLAKKYHKRTKQMKARIEQYLVKAKLPRNVDYMEFEGAECHYYARFYPKTGYSYWEFDDAEFEPGSAAMSECSTCLMFEYLAERWGVLDFADDYADYYDSSYGLGIYDEIEFQVHDRMLGKRFRRYLEIME